MEDKSFDRHVRVSLDGGHSVTSVAGAVDCLLNRWPDGGGARHLAARRACFDVLQGLKQAHVARKAFEKAAAEAKILDKSDDELMNRMMASMGGRKSAR